MVCFGDTGCFTDRRGRDASSESWLVGDGLPLDLLLVDEDIWLDDSPVMLSLLGKLCLCGFQKRDRISDRVLVARFDLEPAKDPSHSSAVFDRSWPWTRDRGGL